ncbi:hypothetical protein OsJ_00352 [Oryza sativa Japonica Group]|uniref:Uncharacterized protein n=1 Tax=Oryza sativa subsp. japonica TaxID=39947 RepID=B9ESU7_ORYSJ|nr:hypothetical protein OsJ_00352 [Oryza sativa Japonica Group]
MVPRFIGRWRNIVDLRTVPRFRMVPNYCHPVGAAEGGNNYGFQMIVQRGASKTTMDKVCATMSWDNGDAFMDMLGRKMMSVMAGKMDELWIGRMEWCVLECNKNAINFYEGMGEPRSTQSLQKVKGK